MRTGALRSRIRRGFLAGCGAACAALLIACTPVGAGVVISSEPPSDAPRSPSPAPTSTLRPETRSAELPAPQPTTPPVRLRIPNLGVDMPVIGVGAEPTGQMELPEDPAVAGWYRYGADAASTAGLVVLAAHVDAVGYPIGPLSRLRELGTGATVEVTDTAGVPRRYAVESLTYYEKTALPTGELFAREGPPGLVLITCGGPFDSTTGHYRDNVVAIARPTP